MTATLSILLSLIFFTLSLIHFYWGLGGKSGSDIAVPTKMEGDKLFSPRLISCFVVGFGLLLMGAFVLVQAGMIHMRLPSYLSAYGLYAIAIIFIVRAIGDFNYIGFFKKVKGTHFAQMDTKYYSPLCVVIGMLAAIIQLNS